MDGIRLSMEGIEVAYNGDITVLRDMAVTGDPGQVTGIIGPNGAGKSTVLKTFFGLLRPKKGRIMLGDQVITRQKAHQRALEGIAFVPQHRSTFADLSVRDNLLLGCWPFRRDKNRMRTAVEKVLDEFPVLRERPDAPASSLSGGQQRFLEIARALVIEPKVILLDEPTAMIAPKISKEIYALIRALADRGATILLVDQNVRSCAAVADKLHILELGRNKAEGSREDFTSDDQLRGMVSEWMDYKIDA